MWEVIGTGIVAFLFAAGLVGLAIFVIAMMVVAIIEGVAFITRVGDRRWGGKRCGGRSWL